LFLTKCPYKLFNDPPKYELESHINLIRDHKDLPLAVVATKNKLDYLVSNDKDFTATDDTTKKIKKKITCLTAGNFLKEVMGWTSENLEKIQRRKWEELEQENYQLWGVDF
jgi:predicted nucleic acid-binding protein